MLFCSGYKNSFIDYQQLKQNKQKNYNLQFLALYTKTMIQLLI